MSSRKEKRWESKKRKLQAFFDVVKSNEHDGIEEKGEENKQKIAKMEIKAQASTKLSRKEKQRNKGKRNKGTREPLPPEVFEIVKARKRARQKMGKESPKFYLTLDDLHKNPYGNLGIAREWLKEQTSDDSKEKDDKQPQLYVFDLQRLFVFTTDPLYPFIKPRWCNLLRPHKVDKILAIVVDNVGKSDVASALQCLPFTKSHFRKDMTVEMVCSSDYSKTALQELLYVPTHRRQRYQANKMKQNNNLSKADDTASDESENRGACSVVDLLLSPIQMIEERYPMPVGDTTKDYIYSKSHYEPVSNNSPIFAMDGEMVLTAAGKHELARISLIDQHHNVLYDKLVKPKNKIINYLTEYSGMTKDLLAPVKTRLEDVWKDIPKLIPPNGILCGQSLNGDLHALKMVHPYCIDTSVIYNLHGIANKKTSLKHLTKHFLGKDIQTSRQLGHSSVEDSIATMELVQLKIQKGLAFGDLSMNGPIPSYNERMEEENNPENKSTKTASESGSNNHKDTDCDKSDKNQDSLMNCENSTDGEVNCTNCSKDSSDPPKTVDPLDKSLNAPFFKVDYSNEYVPVANIAKAHKRSVALVGQTEHMDGLKDKTELVMYETSSDKDTYRDTRKAYEQHYITIAHLSGCMDIEDQDKKEKQLTKIDKYIRKIVTTVQPQTLVTLLFAGKNEPSEHNGALCLVDLVVKKIDIAPVNVDINSLKSKTISESQAESSDSDES